MLWRTHFAFGAGAGAIYAALQSSDWSTTALFAGVSGVAALLPDIDSPHSKLGSKIRPVSDLLNFTLGHRGILHSFVGTAIILALVAAASLFLPSVLLPVIAIGYLSHLFLDALTPGGVPFLWPVKKKYSIPLVKTGSILERVVILPALTVLLCVILFGIVK